MTPSLAYRWDVTSFLRAHEAGVFEGRVESVAVDDLLGPPEV